MASRTASVASHEIAEWMDDPLVNNNATPAWGKVGEVQPNAQNPSGCVNQWEAADPFAGSMLMPPIKVPGDPYQFSYHVQELAYFSFYFNSPSDSSLGASYAKYPGGMFSTYGTLMGPSNACPTGGVAPFQYNVGPPPPPSDL